MDIFDLIGLLQVCGHDTNFPACAYRKKEQELVPDQKTNSTANISNATKIWRALYMPNKTYISTQ